MAELREFVEYTHGRPKDVDSCEEAEVSDGYKLYRTIETEIIPRLMLVHSSRPEATPTCDQRPSFSDLENFADAILDGDRELGATFIRQMRLRGMTAEKIILDLLSPTAQLLGEMWRQDVCSFAEVTIGLSRLQNILRDLGSDFGSRRDGFGAERTVLLAATPGEQHTFGVCVVEEYFRRAGWITTYLPSPTKAEIIRTLRNDHYDVLGLSVSSDDLLGALASVIRDARRSTRNKAMGVMIGGNVFAQNPGWVSLVGADLAAVDGADAVRQAQALVDASGGSSLKSRQL